MFLYYCRFSCSSKLLIRIFVLSVLATAVIADMADQDEIRNLIKYDNMTYEKIQEFYEEMTGLELLRREVPRLFPICVSAEAASNMGDSVAQFSFIFESMNAAYDCGETALPFYFFQKRLHSTTSNTDWISKITLSRLHTTDADVRNLRQWMQIRVDVPDSVEGLYIQTVVGPLGLPSGEFSLEVLPCGQIEPGDNDNIKIQYCEYRSKADFNVLLISRKNDNPTPTVFFGRRVSGDTSYFVVNYKWYDITCLESPYLQFIFVAVKTFKKNAIMGLDFLPLLSPVYTNFEFDSPDGLITPYCYDWSNEDPTEYCSKKSEWKKSSALYHDSEIAPLPWIESSKLDRLPFNENFDDCLIGRGEAGGVRDEIRKECPPGPLQCPSDMSFKEIEASMGFQEIINRRESDFNNIITSAGCIPCFLPSVEEVDVCRNNKSSLRDKNRENKVSHPTDYSELLNSPNDARLHAAIAMLVFFVIIPISNFVGRFYRDTVILRCWSGEADIWVIVHGVLHILCSLLTWVSLGKVTTGREGLTHSAENCFLGDNDTEVQKPSNNTLKHLDECIKENTHNGLHYIFGALTIIVHHLVLIFGCIRGRRRPIIRNLEIALHSHLGYLTYVLATVASLLAFTYCIDGVIWILALVLVTCTAYGLSSCIIFQEDAAIGITPARYHWPVLEHIQILGKSPLQHRKLQILWTYIVTLLLVWIGACCNLVITAASESSAFGEYSKTATNASVAGLIFVCWTPKLKFNWREISV